MGLYDGGISNLNEIRYDWRGDFLGFTIGNVHSSELGIVRTSDGDRYNEELVPTFTDKVSTVSGLDETYYFGAEYTQKTFTIKFSYDSLTDKQIRQLKQIFSKREPQNLIFDEIPYKVYSVKANGQPKLNYICFDENYQRIYKGDGEITFITYFPFARSRYNYLEDYHVKNIPEWGGVQDNKSEWMDFSGIISENTVGLILEDGQGNSKNFYINKFNNGYNPNIGETGESGKFAPIHNPGDVDIESIIIITFGIDNTHQEELELFLNKRIVDDENKDKTISRIKLNLVGLPDGIKGLVIDGKRKLIFGLTNKEVTLENYKKFINKNVIYNNLIELGDFIKIPVCDYKDGYYLFCSTNENVLYDYNYLYY